MSSNVQENFLWSLDVHNAISKHLFCDPSLKNLSDLLLSNFQLIELKISAKFLMISIDLQIATFGCVWLMQSQEHPLTVVGQIFIPAAKRCILNIHIGIKFTFVFITCTAGHDSNDLYLVCFSCKAYTYTYVNYIAFSYKSVLHSLD